MQVSSPPSQAVLQKFGFLIMAPIAVMVHGVFLLIPFSQEQKAKEPEKKEELQPIAAIAQLPPIVPSATPTAKPTPAASVAPPIVQQQPVQQQQPAPAAIVQSQPTVQSVQQPTQQQPTSQPQQPIQQSQQPIQQSQQQPQQSTPQPQQPTVEKPVTSGNVIGDIPGTKLCPAQKNCFRIVSQDEVKKSLENAFETTAQDIPWGPDQYSIGFKIKNKKGEMEYFYIVNATQLQKVSQELKTTEELKTIGVNMT